MAKVLINKWTILESGNLFFWKKLCVCDIFWSLKKHLDIRGGGVVI